MFVIGFNRGTSLVSRAIRWQTRSDYSHAFLLFESGQVIEACEGKGVWTFRYQPSPHHDLFQVNVAAGRTALVHHFATQQLGKGYDYTMALRFVTREQATRKSSNRWFCSELVYAACLQAGIHLLRNTEPVPTEPWEVSPALLSRSPLLSPIPGSRAAS